MIVSYMHFTLNEKRSAGNGWRKLADFMSKHPEVFASSPNRNALLFVMTSTRADLYEFWGSLTLNEMRNLQGKPDHDSDKRPLFDLQMEAAIIQQKSKDVLKRFGLSDFRVRPDWVVSEDGLPRIQPFGRQFGDTSWNGNSLLMPFLGSGTRKVASVSRNGWVFKRFISQDTPSNDTKEMYEIMAAHPEIFAKVRDYNDADGSYWQELLDEEGFQSMWKEDKDRAYNMYHTLAEDYDQLMENGNEYVLGTMDFSEHHNIGLNKDGELRIFDF